jgi:hypothetical protein
MHKEEGWPRLAPGPEEGYWPFWTEAMGRTPAAASNFKAFTSLPGVEFHEMLEDGRRGGRPNG